LRKGLVLNQHIGPLGWQLIPLHLDVTNVTVSAEYGGEILLVCVLRVITNRSVQNRYQMLLDLIHRVIAYNIEPLQMVSKEYLEIVIMRWMKGCIDVMVVRACVRCILYLEIFDEDEVLDDFYIFNLAVFPEE
jgi:hypothetical protein